MHCSAKSRRWSSFYLDLRSTFLLMLMEMYVFGARRKGQKDVKVTAGFTPGTFTYNTMVDVCSKRF
uniref:Uncharacterized protein n=1 Tax=Physcomitrium patens TaxID=3218 RepID=A0A2K1J4A7_PHYPA|nr:hypothetical protein PHYPA_022218 [Physcomitrium patens]